MATKKQTFIAVALAIIVVILFIMLGFFGVSGVGNSDQSNTAATQGAQAVLDELNTTGAVSQLHVIKNIQGEGVAAKAGDTITVHYIGALPDGTQFDSSRDRGTPFSFTLGAGQVIQGWDQGLMGSQVGDHLIIAIPPELGYGATGAGGVIPPNATLLFDVEVLGIESPTSDQ